MTGNGRERPGRPERPERNMRDEALVGPSGDLSSWDADLPYRPMLLRVVGLQIIASTFLTLTFYINWTINPESFEIRSNSEYLGGLSHFMVTCVGLVIGAIICLIPPFLDLLIRKWERIFGFKYSTVRGVIVLVIILTAVTLLVGPSRMQGIALQSFIAFFYTAALIFGVYGIWRLKGTHILISAMFTFFTAISRPKPPTEIEAVLLFGIAFLLFVEVSSSAMRQYMLAAEELVPVKFQTRMVERYVVYLALFTALAVGLTYVSLKGRYFLNIISPLWARESLEVQGLLGLVLPTVGFLLVVALARYLWDSKRRTVAKD